MNQQALTAGATFKVLLNGVLPGIPSHEAKAKLAVLFKATQGQIDKLLANPGYVVKKNCPPDVAAKYKSAIESAGGICELIIEEVPVVSLSVDLPDSKACMAEIQKAESPARPSPKAQTFAGAQKCAAKLMASKGQDDQNGGIGIADITFTSEKTDKGEQYVTVYGL